MQADDVRLLKGAAIPTVLVGAIAAAVAALFAAGEGALGAVIGTFVVCAFFTVGLVVVSYAGRISPAVMMTAAIVSYAVKVLVVMAMLKAFRDVTVFEPKAFGATAIACVVAWTVGEMRGFMKLKLLYADPNGESPGPG